MPRYIDAYLLSSNIQKYLCKGCSTRCTPFEIKHSACEVAECLRMIDDAPTADVQEVRHGRWLDHKHTDTVICSECKKCFCDEKPYCPNCGAKMDGGADNESILPAK